MSESEEATIPTPLPPKIFDRLFQSRTVLDPRRGPTRGWRRQ